MVLSPEQALGMGARRGSEPPSPPPEPEEPRARPPPKPRPAAAYEASHVLIKHRGSARQASWRDPDGEAIRLRTREEAAGTLRLLLDGLARLEGAALKARFEDYAAAHSDCGTGPNGGGAPRSFRKCSRQPAAGACTRRPALCCLLPCRALTAAGRSL